MNSPETMQMIMSTLMDAQATLKALNERSKNYYDMMTSQNEKIHENSAQIKEITNRVEKVEIALANIDTVKEHTTKIDTIIKDIIVLKRDRWWIGAIAGALSGLLCSGVGCVISYFLKQ